MRNILLLLIGSSLLISCGEDDTNLGGRYVNDVFTNLTETYDIEYGRNTTLNGNDLSVYMDIYEPKNDNNDTRATIVMAHGGAFVSGTKIQIRELCRSYARKGYVVASISYRLINDPSVASSDSVVFSEAVVQSIADMRAAIRYIRNNALNGNDYGVDPTNIFVGGVSAGAVMATHVAYLDENDVTPSYLQEHIDDNGGFEGDTNDLNVSSEVSGVIAYSGSLFRDFWMANNVNTPIFMVHEEFDPIVPCDYNFSTIFPFPVYGYGSCVMEESMMEYGIENVFEFYPGSDGHVAYLGDEALTNELIDKSAEFIAGYID